MMLRQSFTQRILVSGLFLMFLVAFIMLVKKENISFLSQLSLGLRSKDSTGSIKDSTGSIKDSSKSSDPCFSQKTCDEDSFNFYIQSGAANVLAAKICVQNKMVLGGALNNAGSGINIVILNGKTAEVIKMEHFNMYSGDVKPLIDFLTNIEKGSIVLMASFDEPSTKLNDEARKLIADLGSSQVKSLGYRDNWVFVGGKGATGYTSFEKIMKNDNAKNKYDNWPELISLDGCIPKYLE